MIEGARLIIEVRAQVPEILQNHLTVELGEKDLPITTKVVLGERTERRVVVLEPGPRLGLTVDKPCEHITAVCITESSRIVGVVGRRFPGVLEIVQPVALRLAEPHRSNRSG